MARKKTAKKAIAKKRKPSPRKVSGKPTTLSPAFNEIVGRMLVDEQFRELFFADRKAALKGAKLTSHDKKSLESIDRKTVDTQASRLTGGRAAVTIAIGISKSF